MTRKNKAPNKSNKKNKFLKNVNKFGGFGKMSYICGVKEEAFPYRYLFKYLWYYIKYIA